MNSSTKVKRADCKLCHETGWRPELPIEQSIVDLLDYFRNKKN
jgi:nucleoside-diphosphate-sugar epimerase